MGKEEDEGYHLLICLSIYQKSRILKEDRYEECGLFVSGQTEYIFKEIYPSNIQQRSKDICQYDRYTFASRSCASPLGDEVIFAHCNDTQKSPRRLCKRQYDQNKNTMHKYTKISAFLHASPLKEFQKIDMVVDNLRAV